MNLQGIGYLGLCHIFQRRIALTQLFSPNAEEHMLVKEMLSGIHISV